MSLNAPATIADKKLLGVLKGERPAVPPMWLMRQAGRYLPEYRALRAQKGGFLELVYDSAAAAEVTLQPLRRFGFDGAILFSDILIVPYAMGQDLWFEAGEGPRLAPILADNDLSALTPDWSRFDAVYDTVRRVKAALNPNVTFLGFAGSPWTIATYMVAGQGSKDHGAARRMAYGEPDRFAALIDKLKLKQPANGIARSREEAIAVANRIGYPVLMRPSYVLGGRAMEIVDGQAQLEEYIATAVQVSGDSPVLIDQYLRDAVEVDVDALCDGEDVVVAGVLQHIAIVHHGAEIILGGEKVVLAVFLADTRGAGGGRDREFKRGIPIAQLAGQRRFTRPRTPH